jgi:DNA-binding SARP family transcriptional activator
LLFSFWPDSTEAQARTNLRKLFYQLRQALHYL